MTETLPLDAVVWDPSIYYSCVTREPTRLWTVRPDVEHGGGWVGRLADFDAGTASETGWGYKLDAVALLFLGWGLPDDTRWVKKASPRLIEMIYVIGSAGGGIVKIGRSLDVARRLRDIQRMSPVQLRVLWHKPGGQALESALHQEFADRRSHGEWFDFGDLDAVALISEAAAR
jgi:hypothetical protein